MAQKIQLRRDTAANWTAANPILAQGEVGFEIDTSKSKVGDGVTAWNSRPYTGVATAGWTQNGGGAVSRTVDSKLKDVVSVKDFGAVGDGVTDDTAAIQAALDSGTAKISVDLGTYRITSRIIIPSNVTLCGDNSKSCIIKMDGADRVCTLGNGSTVSNLTFDSNNFGTSNTDLTCLTVGSNCFVQDVVCLNGYTGCNSSTASNSFIANLTTYNHTSRGLQLDPFVTNFIIDGVISYSNGAAGILIGHGSSYNVVKNFVIKEIPNAGFWIHEGSHHNNVSDGIIQAHSTSIRPGISITAGCYLNTVSNVTTFGVQRGVQITANNGDGVYPAIPDNDSYGNVLRNLTLYGPGSGTSVDFGILLQDVAGVKTARDTVISDCVISGFQGAFRNVSDAANGSQITNIKTSDLGSDGAFGAMIGSTDTLHLDNIEGLTLEKTWLSANLPVDSAGTKTAAFSHGLPYTPTLENLSAELYRVSIVDDFTIDHIWVVAATTTDITVRFKVGTPSATVGAVQKIAVTLNVKGKNGVVL
jgi:hypothetical protein